MKATRPVGIQASRFSRSRKMRSVIGSQQPAAGEPLERVGATGERRCRRKDPIQEPAAPTRTRLRLGIGFLRLGKLAPRGQPCATASLGSAGCRSVIDGHGGRLYCAGLHGKRPLSER